MLVEPALIFCIFISYTIKFTKMKKQILFVFTAILSFALFSCESNPEKVEIKKNSESTNRIFFKQIK